LYVAPFARQEVSGGSVTRKANLAALNASGHKVEVFNVDLAKNPFRKQIDALRGFKSGLNDTRVREILAAIRSSGPDVVFLDTSLFGILAEAIKKTMPEVRIVTFFHNCEYSLYSMSLTKKNFLLRKVLLDGVERNERRAMLYSDTLVFLTERDRMDCERQYGIQSRKYVYSPMSLEDAYVENPDERSWRANPTRLLFVGSYFFPNINGLVWFDRNVLSGLNYTLRIVGRGFENDDFLSRLRNRDKIEAAGFVKDLNEEYRRADVVIQPIFEGSGMKTKTAECLMHGKPLVSTSEGLEGYELEGLPHVCRCDDAAAFIGCLERITREGVPSFSRESRDAFLDRYSTSSRNRMYGEILADLAHE
jgi:glycosyltransferase involved in cell wall biosynthesis